jgi:NADPH:quinone reductase
MIVTVQPRKEGRDMKAVRVRQFGDPSVMKVEEVPDPKPEANQVLVRIRAAGVNPYDTYMRSGAYATPPALPYTPGADGAGIVEAVGDGVRGFAPGDTVYIGGTVQGRAIGAYAEMALCEPAQVHPLPASVSFSRGAAINVPYVTAWRALFHRADAQPGETALIHGASGGVGVAAVQIARAHGMTVLGTAGTERGRALVREQGAHEVFDHGAPDCLTQIMARTGGRGVDVIIEMLANVNLPRDLEMLAMRGRVVIVGSRGPVEINPRLLMGRDSAVMGLMGWNATPASLAAAHAAIGAGLENGTLQPVIRQEVPLTDAPRAHSLVMEPGAFGKIVLVP